MLKKTLCIIVSICFILSLTGCSKNKIWTNKTFDNKISSEKLRDGELIAENNKYELIWVSSNCSVALIEKSSGQRFGTTPVKDGEPQVDALGMPIKKHAQVESAVIVEYLNPDTNIEEQSLSATSAVKNGKVRALKSTNGILVEYYFDDVEIMVPVEYILREDSVAVSINTENIQENKKRVTSVSVTPFWCSIENDSEDSYLFYPSGSGTLINSNTISQAGVTYTSEVYGRDPVMNLDDKVTVSKSVRLPVYGSKSGNIASVAIIENAAESALIEAKVGSSAIKHSGIYTKFQIRGYSENLARFMHGVKKELNIYSLSMIKRNLTIAFYPLIGDKASYSGMAEVYKDYLKKNGFLNEKSSEKTLNVSFIGGTMVDKSFLGVPYKSLLASTTVKDVENILTDILDNTNTSVNAKLIGFGVGGLDSTSYASGFKMDDNLGSNKELSSLSDFCKNNSVDLYFDYDLIKLKNSSSGYSKYFDVAYSSLNKIAYIYDYDLVTRSKIDESKYTLLSRELLSEASKKLLKNISDFDLTGVSLNTLSNTAYSDYSVEGTTKYYSKGQMSQDIQKIYSDISKSYKISGEDANVYTAVLSDVVYNSPLSSSNEIIFYNDIPFYQMIFKGHIALTGETINTADNWKTVFLKSIESGSGLNYLLTQNYYNDYIDYNGNEFYSSKYSDISDKIFEDYTLVSEFYSAIKEQEIKSHKILQNDLRETIYENGVKVYVNYSDKSVVSPIGEVASESFVWGR